MPFNFKRDVYQNLPGVGDNPWLPGQRDLMDALMASGMGGMAPAAGRMGQLVNTLLGQSGQTRIFNTLAARRDIVKILEEITNKKLLGNRSLWAQSARRHGPKDLADLLLEQTVGVIPGNPFVPLITALEKKTGSRLPFWKWDNLIESLKLVYPGVGKAAEAKAEAYTATMQKVMERLLKNAVPLD